MYKGKRILKDKSIIAMSVVSVMALSGLTAAIMISDNKSSSGITQLAALEDEGASLAADTGTTKNSGSTTDNDSATNNDSAIDNSSTSGTRLATNTTDSAGEDSSGEDIADTDSSNENIADEDMPDEGDASVNAPASSLSFSSSSILVWPVETCDIIIDYSMDTTTYFATLDMYKTSDAVCIRSEIGSPVYACTDGVVILNSYNEELGHFITMNLGNEYELTYGQLKDIQIDEGDTLKKGDLIGYVNEPTKYYTVEGANLYLKLTENGTPVDPLDYLDYDKP